MVLKFFLATKVYVEEFAGFKIRGPLTDKDHSLIPFSAGEMVKSLSIGTSEISPNALAPKDDIVLRIGIILGEFTQRSNNSICGSSSF
jgi:hypothetical protein